MNLALKLPVPFTDFQADIPAKSFTEGSLITRLKNREAAAMKTLYKMYGSALNGVIYRMVWNKQCAEDILQESFLKIWRSIESYDDAKGRLFTWMVNIARRTAIDHLRSRNIRNNAMTVDIGACEKVLDGFHTHTMSIDCIGIRKFVNALKADQRMVIELVYFLGYTHQEASLFLEIPLGTVKTRLRMAMNVLRRAMAG